MQKSRRKVIGATGAAVLSAGLAPKVAFAQSAPIKIGMSMPQTGGLGGVAEGGGVAVEIILRSATEVEGGLRRFFHGAQLRDQVVLRAGHGAQVSENGLEGAAARFVGGTSVRAARGAIGAGRISAGRHR